MSADDNWIEGRTTIRFCWATSGPELLVVQTEKIRILDANDLLREKQTFKIEEGDVIELGSCREDWWFLIRRHGGVAFRLGLAVKEQLLEDTGSRAVAKATLSPDGKILACAVEGGAVCLWTVSDGKRVGRLGFELDDSHRDIFGNPDIEELFWAPDSRYLAVRPAFPLEQVTVIDVESRCVVGTVDL